MRDTVDARPMLLPELQAATSMFAMATNVNLGKMARWSDDNRPQANEIFQCVRRLAAVVNAFQAVQQSTDTAANIKLMEAISVKLSDRVPTKGVK